MCPRDAENRSRIRLEERGGVPQQAGTQAAAPWLARPPGSARTGEASASTASPPARLHGQARGLPGRVLLLPLSMYRRARKPPLQCVCGGECRAAPPLPASPAHPSAHTGGAVQEVAAQKTMGLPKRPDGTTALLVLLLLLAVARVRSLEIQAAPAVRAFVGEPVTLKCWFTSSAPLSEKLTVDWTYRPLAGGSLEPILHYRSDAYPAKKGPFRGRISWAGDVAARDASITITNPTLDDNGTFTCAVKNPPDVQHNIPQTVLTVTQRGTSFQLTSAGLLSILVFLPSALVVCLLLIRMGRKFGVLKGGKKPGYKKSSIEVADESEQAGCGTRLAGWCVQCLDTEEEEEDPY